MEQVTKKLVHGEQFAIRLYDSTGKEVTTAYMSYNWEDDTYVYFRGRFINDQAVLDEVDANLRLDN
jgi:hypothetical protein